MCRSIHGTLLLMLAAAGLISFAQARNPLRNIEARQTRTEDVPDNG